MDPSRAVEAMRDWGVDVRLYEPDGVDWWRHTTPGGFTPVGVMHHHTTGPRSLLTSADSIKATLRLLRNGREGLPGPLCHSAPAMVPGTSRACVWMVGWGNVNHAGVGSSRTLSLVKRAVYDGRPPVVDDIDGNPWYFGLEYLHPGDSTRWPDALLDAGHRTGIALCEAFGLPGAHAGRQVEHREHTARKIDRSWQGDLRAAVKAIMEADMALTGTDALKVWQTDASVEFKPGDVGYREGGDNLVQGATALRRISNALGARVDAAAATAGATLTDEQVGAVAAQVTAALAPLVPTAAQVADAVLEAQAVAARLAADQH